jgi:hypothetical protein
MATAANASQVSARPTVGLLQKPGPLVDLGLTLPIFVLYHLGVVHLRVRNGTDLVTGPLVRLADGNQLVYFGITLGIGVVFGLVFWLLGRGKGFSVAKLVQTAIEGVLYAIAMRLGAAYIVGRMFAGPIDDHDPYQGLVMSLGAGFYEELAFRVVLFGLVAKLLVHLFSKQSLAIVSASGTKLSFRSIAIMLGWAVIAASIFSGVHYIGALGDDFRLNTFVFRMLLGLALSIIYMTRGFAAAVWSHALYDVWVLVL